MSESVEQNISLDIVIHPPHHGSIRPVGLGIGALPTIIIEAREDPDNEDTIVLALETAAPFTQDASGISDIADILETIAAGLRSQDFRDEWQKVNGS